MPLIVQAQNLKRMSIVERAALWYRLERIGQEDEPGLATIERRTVYVENLTDGKFLQLQAEVHNLRMKVATLLDKKRKYKYV